MPSAQQSRTRRNVDAGGWYAPQLWRRLIFGAVHDAKLTHCGIPTSGAIYNRLWIERVGDRTDRTDWLCSFDHACDMLGRDAAALRVELLARVDAAWRQAMERHVQSEIYLRRMMVLTCAGVPMRLARQSLLPLVDPKDYEDVAGVDHGDQYTMYDQVEETA